MMIQSDLREGEVVEWAHRLDCEKNGCDPKHSDDGRLFPMIIQRNFRRVEAEDISASTARRYRDYTVNGHATTLVKRKVTREPWEQHG